MLPLSVGRILCFVNPAHWRHIIHQFFGVLLGDRAKHGCLYSARGHRYHPDPVASHLYGPGLVKAMILPIAAE